MACINCLQNCGGKVTSDQCIEYTGDPVPLLGICTGDQLSSVEAAVVNGLLTALNGTGITTEQVTLANCQWLANQFVGQDPTLVNFLQLFANANCSLYEMVVALQNANTNNATFTTSCLANLPTNPTPTQVLQALTLDYCTLKATVTAIPSTYVTQASLSSLVTQILDTLGITGGSTTVSYNQYVPLGAILPYYGSISNFDNSGKGLTSAGLSGMYLANGENGTPDLRGRTLVGAVRNVPGGQLAAPVDPTQPNNPNTNYSLGDQFGENYHTLITTEIPSHNHSVIDPGHQHTSAIPEDQKAGGVSGYNVLSTAPPTRTGTFTLPTSVATTGITIGYSGSGSFHNNVQPSAAIYWIIRMV